MHFSYSSVLFHYQYFLFFIQSKLQARFKTLPFICYDSSILATRNSVAEKQKIQTLFFSSMDSQSGKNNFTTRKCIINSSAFLIF